MAGLGYDRYGAQGGDWGSMVSTQLADRRPRATSCGTPPQLRHRPARRRRRPERRSPRGAGARWRDRRVPRTTGTGYQEIQGTKPQTLGYGLETRPPGWRRGSSRSSGRGPTATATSSASFTKDQLLTNIMLVLGHRHRRRRRRASTTRRARRARRAAAAAASRCRPASPTSPARSRGRRARGSRRATTSRTGPSMPRGGHFAAMEVPELFVDDVRAFFRPLR